MEEKPKKMTTAIKPLQRDNKALKQRDIGFERVHAKIVANNSRGG